MPPKSMTANPVRAPRYRPGIATANSDSSSEPESSEDECPPESVKTIAEPPKVTTAVGITSQLKTFDLGDRRRKAALEESARLEEQKKKLALEENGFVTESSEEDEEGTEEEESSDEEENSEEEAPRPVLMRPVYIKKENRRKIEGKVIEPQNQEKQIEAEMERKIAVDEIVEEQIQKDLAAKAAGKKYWDDDEEVDEVDDTDNIDPEAEYAAWKLRELRRIKREREEIEEKEREREEIERRQNLTVEERKREDDEYIAKQKEEKEGRSKMSYMQKYYHKGAFYQEEAEAQGLLQRNIMGAKIQDEVDREILPKYFQQRDLSKIGKKGATKYRDLKSEDTGQWGQFDYKSHRNGFGAFNTDERFKPDRDKSGPSATGSNSLSINSPRIANNYAQISQEQSHTKRSISHERKRDESHKRHKVDSSDKY
ncbi:putative micro-fibrillar-associated protein 1 [Erysiphe neolycopersici]|uniref:Putative micro-fibrillar-associated protein 1 n=1 Tax=Erysiphe neolycopersici TaxID=212602 RepID=A0A420HEF1_9PEZI|nr:putative micro-fibrillar-associated protein 1 [Erysiphe neolycopersici]